MLGDIMPSLYWEVLFALLAIVAFGLYGIIPAICVALLGGIIAIRAANAERR